VLRMASAAKGKFVWHAAVAHPGSLGSIRPVRLRCTVLSWLEQEKKMSTKTALVSKCRGEHEDRRPIKDRNRISADEEQCPCPLCCFSSGCCASLSSKKETSGSGFSLFGGAAISLLAKRLDPLTAYLQSIRVKHG
jgi:hypothetical protein